MTNDVRKEETDPPAALNESQLKARAARFEDNLRRSPSFCKGLLKRIAGGTASWIQNPRLVGKIGDLAASFESETLGRNHHD